MRAASEKRGLLLMRLRDVREGATLIFDLGGVRSSHYSGVATLERIIKGLRAQFPGISLIGLKSETESAVRRLGL